MHLLSLTPRSRPFFLPLVLALAGLSACSSATSGTGSTGAGGQGGSSQNAAVTAIFGSIKDTSGSPIVGAAVRVGSSSATSDDGGQFQVAVGAGRTAVQIDAKGFALSSELVDVHQGQASALEVRLLRETPPVDLDASAGGTVDGPRGSRMEAPSGAFVDPSGKVVEGVVQVSLTPLDPRDAGQMAAAPGDLSARAAGGAVVLLESFGMLDVTVRQGDKRLNIAPGKKVKVSIPAPSSGPTPETMPLWSFDMGSGQWVEEGVVALDPSSKSYQAELPHLSFWNADHPIEATCITGLIKDTSGAPLAGAHVTARGVDYSGASDATAGPDGRFYVAVRRSSEIDVLAIHQAGGGQERRVSSGEQGTNIPPTAGDVRCLDVGEWSVKKGTVSLVGQGPISCDGYANPLANCQPKLQSFFACFRPTGACKQKGFDSVYENGASISIEIDTASSSVTSTYRSDGGVLCGTATTKVNGTPSEQTSSATTVYKLADGSEVPIPVTTYDQGARIELGCQDGSTLDLQGDELRRWEACSGGGDSCEQEQVPGLPLGSTCTQNSECQQQKGHQCCDLGGAGRLCQLQSLCIGSDACQADADCQIPGTICCLDATIGGGATIGNKCLTEVECYSQGKCKDDGQCQQGERCCGGFCKVTENCDGACAVDADCEAGSVCCGEAPDKYCTDASSCYGGKSCSANGDCGGGLLCCGESGSESCQSEQDCFRNKPCASDSECGPSGALGCCEQQGVSSCQTAVDCQSGQPCSQDADCPTDGFVCCDYGGNSLCLQGTLCYAGKPCEQASDCPATGLTCCAIAGAGKFCIEEASCGN